MGESGTGVTKGKAGIFDEQFYFVDCRERTNYLDSALECIRGAIGMNVPWVCGIVGSPMSGKHAFMQNLIEELDRSYPGRYPDDALIIRLGSTALMAEFEKNFPLDRAYVDLDEGGRREADDSYRAAVKALAEKIVPESIPATRSRLVLLSDAEYNPLVSQYMVRKLLELGFKDIIYTSQKMLADGCTSGAVEYIAKMGPLSQQQSYSMLRRICAAFRNANISFEEFLALDTVSDLSDPALITVLNEYFRESHQSSSREEVMTVLNRWRTLTHALFGRTHTTFDYLENRMGHWCDCPGYRGVRNIDDKVRRVSGFLMFNNNAITVKRKVIDSYLRTNYPEDYHEDDVDAVIRIMRDFSMAFYEDLSEDRDDPDFRTEDVGGRGLRLSPTMTEGLRTHVTDDMSDWKNALLGAAHTLNELAGDPDQNIDLCMYLNVLGSMLDYIEREEDESELKKMWGEIDRYLRRLLDTHIFDIPLRDTIDVLRHFIKVFRRSPDRDVVLLVRRIYPIVADAMASVDCGLHELDFNVELTELQKGDLSEYLFGRLTDLPKGGVSGLVWGGPADSPFRPRTDDPGERRDALAAIIRLAIAHLGLLSKRPRLQHRTVDGKIGTRFGRCEDLINWAKDEVPAEERLSDDQVNGLRFLLNMRRGEFYLDREPREAEPYLDKAEDMKSLECVKNDPYLGPMRYRLALSRARTNLMLCRDDFERKINDARSIALNLFNEAGCPVRERIMAILLLTDIEIRSDNLLEAKFYLDDAYRRIFQFRFQKDNLLARFEEKCGDYELCCGNIVNAKARYQAALRYYAAAGMFWLRAITASKIYRIDSDLNILDEQNRYLLDEVLTFCGSELGKEYTHSHLEILRRLGGVSNNS